MLSYDFIINTFKKRGANKYILIKKFSPEDSKLIYDALINSSSSVYFSDKGSIDVVTETTEKTFGNPLTGYNRNNSTNIELKVKSITNKQKYVFSRLLGLYVLYIESPTSITLRYNPVPRPEMLDFFKQDDSAARGLILNACLDTNGLDPICSCINRNEETTGQDTEFCMNDLFGTPALRKSIKAADRTAYDNISGSCFCTNSKCEHTHPIVKNIMKADKGTCDKDLIITICNSTINAGKDLTAQDINLEQKCGATKTTQAAPEPTPAPTPSEPTPVVTGSTYTSTASPSSTTATTKPATTAPKKVTQIQAPQKQKDNTIYIIIAIALVIVLIVAYFMLRSPSQRFYRRRF